MLNRDLARTGQDFVREAWYLAAWSDELDKTPLGVMLLGESIVLYRRGDASPVALENRCAHRSLPLSLGCVRGELIECAYHGLQFDASGRCVHVPGQSRPPRRRHHSQLSRGRAGSLHLDMDGSAAERRHREDHPLPLDGEERLAPNQAACTHRPRITS